MNCRFPLIASLCVSLLATGCATPLIPNGTSFTINAAPGHFQAFQAKIRVPDTGVDTTDVKLRFLKLQPSDRWAPLLAVCVEGAGTDAAKSCLHLAAMPNGEVIAGRSDKEQGSHEFQRERYGAGYRPGDIFSVRVEARESSVGFSVNGHYLFGSSVVQGPATVEFSCSSAVCNFEVE